MHGFIKHAVNSIVFVTGLFVMLLVISQLLVPKNNTKDDGMQDSLAYGILAEPENTIDVLILGDSESYCSVIPLNIWQQYGITSYCCGTGAQKLCYSQELLNKVFEHQSPKVILLETNMIFRDFSYSDLMLHNVGSVLPVLNYHHRWKSLKSSDLKMAVNYTNIVNTKGYEFDDAIDPANAEGYMSQAEECAPLSRRNRVYFKKIISYCEDQGAKVILFSVPSTVNWNMPRHNCIQKMSEEFGLDYIDTNLLREQITIDWQKDTRDKGDHMNHSGAQKVTDYIGEYLYKADLVKSHKDDKEYKCWDSAVENFNKSMDDSLI